MLRTDYSAENISLLLLIPWKNILVCFWWHTQTNIHVTRMPELPDLLCGNKCSCLWFFWWVCFGFGGFVCLFCCLNCWLKGILTTPCSFPLVAFTPKIAEFKAPDWASC